jgi:hypothetical protein
VTGNEPWALIVGPFGALVLLGYIAKRLADIVLREWEAKDVRIRALDAANDKLADALRDSNALWAKKYEDDKAAREADERLYGGPDRRRHGKDE